MVATAYVGSYILAVLLLTRLPRVLSVKDPSPNSITTFHDLISSQIPKILGRWSFELKIFKSNTQGTSTDSQFLYDLSYGTEQSVTIVDGLSIVTTGDIPKSLIQSGSSNGACDSLDHIIQTKLQSLWLVRQTLKGENGNSYEIKNGEFIIKAINVFLHGNFKSFIIVIEYTGKKKQGIKLIEQLARELHFPEGELCIDQLGSQHDYLSDLAYQYTKALQV
jgi:hypothetical protein